MVNTDTPNALEPEAKQDANAGHASEMMEWFYQQDAKVIATYYNTLARNGVSKEDAAILTRDFQAAYLAKKREDMQRAAERAEAKAKQV